MGSAVRERTCSIQLSFLDNGGQELARADMEVDPSHAASFQHAPARSALQRGAFLIRGRVTKTGDACADSELVTTLEVLDGTGKTKVLQSATVKSLVDPVLATSAVFRAGTALVCSSRTSASRRRWSSTSRSWTRRALRPCWSRRTSPRAS